MAQIMLEELEAKFLSDRLKIMFRQAYEQGVKDGIEKFSLPPNLTKEQLKYVFQVEMPTVTKIVAHPSFPKLKRVRARYPRDQVFRWIEENSQFINKMKAS